MLSVFLWLWLMRCVLVRCDDEGPDAQEIVDRLYLGSCAAAQDLEFLVRSNVSLVVSVTPEAECAQPFPHVVTYLRVDLKDDGMHKMGPFVDLIWSSVDAALARGASVLIHCLQGRSRSPAVVAYVLMRNGTSLHDAMAMIREKRTVEPRFQLFQELLDIETALFGISSTSHRANYVPIVLHPPGEAVAAVSTGCEMPVEHFEAGLVVGDEFLLTEKLHEIHEAARLRCNDCVQVAGQTQMQVQMWPRCALRQSAGPADNAPADELAVFSAPSSFSVVERLDHGGQGEVWRGVDPNGSACILKRLFAGAAKLVSGQREVHFGERLADVHGVARFRTSFWRGPDFFLVFDDHGRSLHRLLYSAATTGEATSSGVSSVSVSKFWTWLRRTDQGQSVFRDIIRQAALALASIAERGVTHRDVKPGNILISFAGADEPVVHICDFGSAFAAGTAFPEQGVADLTVDYAAPEVLRGTATSPHPSMDVWSLGVVVLEVLFGSPFVFAVPARRAALLQQKAHGDQELMARLYDAALDELHLDSADEFRKVLIERDPLHLGGNGAEELLRSMLQIDPSRRVSAREVAAHAWLQRRRADETKTTD